MIVTPLDRRQLRGFTLVETLVVMAIIGILVALLVPAVAYVRESARRVECTNRLKQLGIALQSHHATHRVFPAPMPARVSGAGKTFAGYNSISGYYDILPFVEQSPMYNAVNMGFVDPSGQAIQFGPLSPANTTVFNQKLSIWICPSDGYDANFKNGPNSYRFNVGLSNPLADAGGSRAGSFDPVRAVSSTDVRDGLSQTVGVSERLLGHADALQYEKSRHYWCANVVDIINPKRDDDTLSVCRSLVRSPSRFLANMGESWMFGGAVYLWYNHVAPPNDRGSDCATSNINTSEPQYCHTCSIAARSNHANGVNGLMLDGSVRFFSGSTNLQVWRALGTRSGGEVVSAE